MVVDIATGNVLGDNVQAIAARSQRNRFMVNRGSLDHLRQRLGGYFHRNHVFKHVDHTPRHRSDAGIDVHHGLRHAFLGLELQVLAVKLNGDVAQNAGVGEPHEIRAHTNRQRVVTNARTYRALQILEFHGWWFLELRELFQTLKLVHALR